LSPSSLHSSFSGVNALNSANTNLIFLYTHTKWGLGVNLKGRDSTFAKDGPFITEELSYSRYRNLLIKAPTSLVSKNPLSRSYS
jgi:hypothetical protein